MSQVQLKSCQSSHKYCRKCYYILDALTENRCPECGRPFDPLRRLTYRTRSRRQWWKLFLLCTGTTFFLTIAGAGAFAGWVYWAYRTCQAERTVIRRTVPTVIITQELWGPAWLAGRMRSHGLLPLTRARSAVLFASDEKGLACVAQLKGLRHLEISTPGYLARPCDESKFLQLDGLTELENLSVSGYWLTESSLAVIGRFHGLKQLALADGQITDAGLERLAGLRHLEGLTLKNLPITGQGLAHLASVRKLKQLSLTGNLKDKCAVHLGLFPRLESLNLDDTAASHQAAAAIGKLNRLKRLSVRNTPIDDEDVRQWGGLTDLQWLSLDQTWITGRSLGMLSSTGQLHTLGLADTKIDDEGMAALGKLTGLVNLDLRRTEITDVGIRNLVGHKNLRVLDLSGTAVTDSGIADLVTLPITELDLNLTAITDAALVKLIKLQSLEKLRVDHTRITNRGLAAISLMTKMQYVHIHDNEVTYDGILALRSSRPTLRVHHNVRERFFVW